MAQKETSKIIVVDLECLCWDEQRSSEESEIIEIGICVLDFEKSKIDRKKSFVVRPNKLDVSEFCTNLTGHTLETIKDGQKLNEALNTIKKEYPLNSHVWGSWGFYDRNKIESECRNKNIINPFPPDHFNLKTLHAMINGLHKGVGLAVALKLYNMKFEGRHHNGSDDAFNTARVCYRMLKGKGIEI